MYDAIAALFFGAMLGSIALTWWLLYFRHPPTPKPPKQLSPYYLHAGPDNGEQRLTNNLLMVLILALAGQRSDH